MQHPTAPKTLPPAMIRPDSFEKLKETITNQYGSLSRRLQQVGEYALAHPDDIALETIVVIADRAKVPPSSLIRFAKALGFEGFTDMQRLFRARLVARAPSYSERIRLLDTQNRQTGSPVPSAMLHDFSRAGIDALERLRRELPLDRLDQAVDILAKAPQIHIAAQRRAFPVAAYLAYLLSELGCRSHLLDGIGGMLEQQERMIGQDDTLVLVSFRPYAPEIVALAERRQAKTVSMVAITDSPLSPLVRPATVSFEIMENEVHAFRSLTAPMCLALTLAVSLGHRVATKQAKNDR